jgi:hypothetical protein
LLSSSSSPISASLKRARVLFGSGEFSPSSPSLPETFVLLFGWTDGWTGLVSCVRHVYR